MLVSAETDETALELLQAVADPMRWRILNLLAAEELCSTHLQDILGAKQTLVSHHLRVLREAGLVTTSPCGRFSYYRLVPAALAPLGEAVAELVEAAATTTPPRRAC